jgi:hypothetical protein
VVGDHWLASDWRKLRVPIPELGFEMFEKCQSVRFVIGTVCGVDLCQGLEDIAGNDLGVLGIEPIVRISAGVCMPVAGTDARAALIEDRNRL